MASFFSTPKAPTVRPYVPPKVIQNNDIVEDIKTDKEISADVRKQSLLRRARGKSGTVLTSFNKLLDGGQINETAPKKLLGE